jgi:nitroreductase
LAPTTHNDQGWEFIVVTDADRRRRLAEVSDYGKFIADAPACIVVLSRPTRYHLEDGCAATTIMLVAATALGLGACWVAGEKNRMRRKWCLTRSRRRQLVSLIAVSYRGPRSRKRSGRPALESFGPSRSSPRT